MSEQIVRESVEFVSHDGKTTVHGFVWWPDQPTFARGIVQLVHGMAEHIGRYDSFARFLAGQGFVVCGHDHVGHGASVISRDKWGCLPAKGGRDVLVNDVATMRTIATARATATCRDGDNLPYVLFGHSMGSFVVRAYIASPDLAKGLGGAIICGTGFVPPTTSRAGSMLARSIARLRGQDSHSSMLHNMAEGAFNKGIANPRTDLDWLSYDEANVDAYIADEQCGFAFSAGGYATLMTLTGEVCNPYAVINMPPELPLLYISGAEDPVGDSGAGVREAAEMARRIGVKDVSLTLYEGMRHEILNEAGHDKVYQDVLAWIEGHVLGDASKLVTKSRWKSLEGSFVMALDQGTTSSRAMLVNRAGLIVESEQRDFPQIYPQSGWVEHDPAEILISQLIPCSRLFAGVAQDGGEVRAIGIANQRETTLVWDRATGEPIANAIVWQCRRTAGLVERLCGDPAVAERVRAITGLAPDAYFSASKIAWLLESVPGARQRAEAGELAFGTVDTWLLWNLTGGQVHATDVTNASRTMLFDIHECRWSPEMLELFGIPEALLPTVLPSAGEFGVTAGPEALDRLPYLRDVFARAHMLPTAVPAGVPILGMAGDQQAALFGQCCFDAGQAKCTYGTGCFLLMNTGAQPRVSSHGLLTTIAASAPGTPGTQYALEGSVFVGGAVVQWMRDEVGLVKSAPETEAVAQQVPDTGGVYIVPAFTGLGAPYWNPDARGLICGVTRGTTRAHLVRAGLESMAYQVGDLMAAMAADAGEPLAALRVDGGASANAFLMQFQADVLQTRVARPACVETTALGAAYLAGLTCGYWKDVDALRALLESDDAFDPKMAPDAAAALVAGWHDAVRRAQ